MKLLTCRAVLLLVCLCPFSLVHADNGARVAKYFPSEVYTRVWHIFCLSMRVRVDVQKRATREA